MQQWVDGRIIEKIRWNERLFSLRIEAQIDDFAAGQFTKVALDLNGERVGRPYSYVNAPHERPIEIYFNTVPDGPLSNRLAASAPGDTLWVSPRPNGLLTLDEIPPAEHLWMMCTGTGLGPFLSIVKTNAPWQRFEHVVLVQAVRHERDLAYAGHIRTIVEQHGGQLSFIPFVSREPTDFALSGRIPAAIIDGRLEARAGLALSPDASHVMLCGNAQMIQDTIEALADRGMQRHRRREPGHISMEKYH
jgi:ferredoxin--NADP+ reductase